MAAITIRNLPDEVHRALKAQAQRHGRSAEAEVREILEKAVAPANRIRLGTLLAEIGRKAGIEDGDLDFPRDASLAEPMDLE